MPTAEIITIGTEILLGEIIDTNAPYLARALRDLGMDVFRKTTIGDNPVRIAEAIQHALERTDFIITTGGLGPTIDDPTREAVALAAGVELEYRPELWEQIEARFRRFGRTPTENNKRQAYIPQGATPVENQVGTAPSFVIEVNGRVIYSLPGVPREMEYLLEHAVTPYLRQRFALSGIIKSRLLHTSGAGESQIDEYIADLEKNANPTVGLAAHAGQVTVRITAKAGSLEEADAMLLVMENEIRQRLGSWIYGTDSDTLEQAALQVVMAQGWRLGAVEAGLGGCLTQRLSSANGKMVSGDPSANPFSAGEVLTVLPDPADLLGLTRQHCITRGVEAGLGAALYPAGEKQDLIVILVTPNEESKLNRSYGGPPLLAPTWAANVCLDILRRI